MERYLCIHCHFYQPPRENPWLEAVELQDSAAPYHDWNERVAAECYVPNGASRILDSQGRIARIVNNYARISFNFGPTLLSWMEENAPRTYEQVLEADRQSRKRFSGHGAAIAQAYNHLILPLANSRDKYTQVLWGVRDFQQRFRRDPEGMWLPETAVDLETLSLLESLGIQFAILAPRQARRVRSRPWEDWSSVEGGAIDPTRAYACCLPSGRTISLFFYDGPISHAVAFENLLCNGEVFARRLLEGFHDARDWPQLVHIATDGETYGHHHRHGDMALAYALDFIEQHRLARVTNYGEYLAANPPAQEVGIFERSSWSCVHGVTRWEADCGCSSGTHPAWNQLWRRPLRESLDWLRDRLAPLYELSAAELLQDPWAARDDYIAVINDRSPSILDAFFARHARHELALDEQVQVLKLLEMQRHLMLMYTSCGWFFDELTGLETLQVLHYAGRAAQLAQELFGGPLEEEFLLHLQEAWSNLAEFGNGRQVYERFIRPARLDLVGVGAHYAISSLFDGYRGRSSVYCYRVDLLESRTLESGKARLALGRARVSSRVTRERQTLAFAVLHLGDHTLSAGVGPSQGRHALRCMAEEVTRAFSAAELPECLRLLDRHFHGAAFSLKSLFRDQQRRILSQIVRSTVAETAALYRHVYEHHAPLINFLSDLRMPLPPTLRVTAEFVLGNALQQAFLEPQLDVERVRMWLETAARNGLSLDVPALELALRQRLNTVVDQWALRPGDLELLEMVEAAVSLVRLLPFEVNLWRSQNVYFELLQGLPRNALLRSGNGSEAWLDHFSRLGEQLGAVPPSDVVLERGACELPPQLPQPASASHRASPLC